MIHYQVVQVLSSEAQQQLLKARDDRYKFAATNPMIAATLFLLIRVSQ